jgi:hypothetical protein
MGEFKRRAGQSLGLSLDLRPDPSETRYVSAFLFDKSGAPLVPASVNLTDNGGGNFTENTTPMQSTAQMRAKYRVFEDAGRTIEDCEYLGGEDTFDLEELLPSQLPGEPSLTGEIQSQTELMGELKEPEIEAMIQDQPLAGELTDERELEGDKESTELSGDIDEQNLEGEIK